MRSLQRSFTIGITSQVNRHGSNSFQVKTTTLALSMVFQTPHRRGTTHCFVRPPASHVLPNSLDTFALVEEFHDFYTSLQMGQLVDEVHVLPECPTLDSVRIAETVVTVGMNFLVVPKTGIEHRTTEIHDTIRSVRAHGATGNVVDALQKEGMRANACDVLTTTYGFVVGVSDRTNKLAVGALRHTFSGSYAPSADHTGFSVVELHIDNDSPPLNNFFFLSGPDTVIAWKDKNGMKAVQQYTEMKPEVHTVVYIEPGCNVFSLHKMNRPTHIIVESGMTKSIEAISNIGLQVIPVPWKQMKSSNFAMMSTTLVMEYRRQGGIGEGAPNVNTETNRRGSGRWNEARRDPSSAGQEYYKSSQVLEEKHGERAKGRWQWHGILDRDAPVRQEPPRYRPPMRRPGAQGIVPQRNT
eukprot:PhF_6_TR34214/c0_g1_i4/m.50170